MHFIDGSMIPRCAPKRYTKPMKTPIRLQAIIVLVLLTLFSSRGFTAGVKSPRLKEGTVIYGMIAPLFGKSAFTGATQHLDRLADLGVDVIWLSPVNRTDDPSLISYSVTDFMQIREDFGTAEELKSFVNEAHNRGMKVILDIIPNHTSSNHPFNLDANASGEKSKYWKFYERDDQGDPTYYFDWNKLPNLNYANPEVRKHITQAFRYWIETYGIDGYRIDVAWGPTKRAPDFWPRLRAELNRTHPGAIFLAEASIRDPYYATHGFDLAYDWTDDVGVWSWKKGFDNLSRIGDFFERHFAKSEPNANMTARYLNNNDTGDRFITKFGPEIQKVAAVLQFLTPGTPILYTGDEVGAEFKPYDDETSLNWSDRHHLTPLYRKLAQLRKTDRAFTEGVFMNLKSKGSPKVYSFARTAKSSWALVVLNFGSRAAVEIETTSELPQATSFCDLLSNKVISIERKKGRAKIVMPKKSAYVLSDLKQCPST